MPSQEHGVHPPLGLVVRAKGAFDSHGPTQSSAEAHSLSSSRTTACVVELPEEDVARASVPRLPAFGVDNIAKQTVLPDNTRIRTPRAA
ncbi:hypothetical protein ON010_g18940 [Phytophthora cinnamomi]|nr:hypothetical protein ON010_g18940 [Phytophthora cinnamomi]